MVDFDRLIALSANPGTTALRLERMREDASLRNEIDSLPEEIMADFMNIISYSNFLFNFMCRNPTALRLLGSPCDLAKDPLAHVYGFDALRRYKYEQLLKITWMDISNSCPYESVLNCLSLLADVIIKKAFQIAFALDNKHKLNELISVFALGKLGAGELNYSSDVDLVFAGVNYDEIKTDAHELQQQLSDGIRRLTGHLEERTDSGFLYRVDLKLRPWGKSGALFMSVDETENYYAASTEAWERLAWLRARPVAGSEKISAQLLARMHPFIFMRSLSTTDLERFIVIKEAMAKVRVREGQWHVKLGQGGIRDLEFFIQILQLVNAGRHVELRNTNTLTILRNLQRLGFIRRQEKDEINSAYLFLRRLENRLQMVDEQQSHALPDDEKSRISIARSLDVNGGSDNAVLENFERRLATHRAIAARYFEQILPGLTEENSSRSKEPAVTFTRAWNRAQAETSYTRWIELCDKQKWGDRPEDKNLLINIFGASWYFTRYIFFRGYEITELIDNYREKSLDAKSITESLRMNNFEQDLEQSLNILSSIKNQWMLLILIQYLQEETNQARLEKDLTLLAECVFVALMELMIRTYKGSFKNIAVLAMGRTAGCEMTFGSDLDLVFLYKTKSLGEAGRLSDQIQRLLRHLATVSPAGLLYEVDMRLRPHGTAGSLITSTASFVEYHKSEREVWERQMMTRCRPIYDPEGMGCEALQKIATSVYAEYDIEKLRVEITGIRKRVEQELGKPKNKYEIKRGKGGLMDIDFITHFLQLAHGKSNRELQVSSTRAALKLLSDLNYLAPGDSGFLLAAYDFLKRAEMSMRLIDLKSSSVTSSEHKKNRVLSRAMGFGEKQTEEFMTEYLGITQKIREKFTRIIATF